MKFSARLVTALAAVVVLAGAIVGLSTRAQAYTAPADMNTAPPVIVQLVDLHDISSGDAALAVLDSTSIATVDPLVTLVQSQEVRTTQVMTSSLAKDIGTITAVVLVGLVAIAFTNATTRRYIARSIAFIAGKMTWLRTWRSHGVDVPTTSDVDSLGLRHADSRDSTSTRDTVTRTRSRFGQGSHSLQV